MARNHSLRLCAYGDFFLFVYVAFFMMVVDDPVSSWGMQSPVMHGFMVYAADRRVRSIVF